MVHSLYRSLCRLSAPGSQICRCCRLWWAWSVQYGRRHPPRREGWNGRQDLRGPKKNAQTGGLTCKPLRSRPPPHPVPSSCSKSCLFVACPARMSAAPFGWRTPSPARTPTMLVCFVIAFTLQLAIREGFCPQRPSGQAMVIDASPSSPRYPPSFFIAHRVQHSHFSAFYVLVDYHRVSRQLTRALALWAYRSVRKNPCVRFEPTTSTSIVTRLTVGPSGTDTGNGPCLSISPEGLTQHVLTNNFSKKRSLSLPRRLQRRFILSFNASA